MFLYDNLRCLNCSCLVDDNILLWLNVIYWFTLYQKCSGHITAANIEFFCFFMVFCLSREFFDHIETSPLPVKGCTFWFLRHSRPFSSEGYLACHTLCDTGDPIIMVISEDPWHSHLLPTVQQWSWHYLFYWLKSVVAGIRTQNLPLVGPTL